MLTVTSTSAIILPVPNTAVQIAKRRRGRPTKAEVSYRKQELTFLSKITVNSRMMLPEFSYKQTRHRILEKFK